MLPSCLRCWFVFPNFPDTLWDGQEKQPFWSGTLEMAGVHFVCLQANPHYLDCHIPAGNWRYCASLCQVFMENLNLRKRKKNIPWVPYEESLHTSTFCLFCSPQGSEESFHKAAANIMLLINISRKQFTMKCLHIGTSMEREGKVSRSKSEREDWKSEVTGATTRKVEDLKQRGSTVQSWIEEERWRTVSAATCHDRASALACGWAPQFS